MPEPIRALSDALADHYAIERELGAGGMARVYLARDVKHGREVAIKVMRSDLTATLGADRFLREIQLLARLQHPGILGLVDSGEADGALYYVMPYLSAGSLRVRLDRESELPLDEGLRILREIGEALAYAHELGIVHRDIKPENVLFSAGHAQVADFGIARIVSDGSVAATALTTLGVSVGTPLYMAPEQAQADPKLDHRADLYAFGALAYEMFAGVPPFTAPNAVQLMAMHKAEPPVPLARRRPSMPPSLNDVVMRCLEKRPADRWQSARQLIAALERVSTSATGEARPRSGGTITASMPLTGSLVSRIDRSHFDPRMIGDAMEYLDNQLESDVLVMLLNAAWLDGSDLEPHLRMLPYHCITPTLYGFQANPRHRFDLSLEDHLVLLGELLRMKIAETRPALVIVGGFSSAGDVMMRLVAKDAGLTRPIDGLLALGCNQAMETCFVSRVLARLDMSDRASMLRDLNAFYKGATNIDDWIIINGYMGRIMPRFRRDLTPLKTLAGDIIRPFEADDAGAFAVMYREAAARVRVMRCIFEDSEPCNRLLKAALIDHLDRGALGPHHRDGALLIEPTESHFELLQPERVAKHLAAMVTELRP